MTIMVPVEKVVFREDKQRDRKENILKLKIQL